MMGIVIDPAIGPPGSGKKTSSDPTKLQAAVAPFVPGSTSRCAHVVCVGVCVAHGQVTAVLSAAAAYPGMSWCAALPGCLPSAWIGAPMHPQLTPLARMRAWASSALPCATHTVDWMPSNPLQLLLLLLTACAQGSSQLPCATATNRRRVPSYSRSLSHVPPVSIMPN